MQAWFLLWTHLNDRQGFAEALRSHPQQVFQLGDTDVDGGRGGEAPNQGLRQIDRHKSKPKEAKGQLEQRGENRENTVLLPKKHISSQMDGRNVPRLTWMRPTKVVSATATCTRLASLAVSFRIKEELDPLADGTQNIESGASLTTTPPIIRLITAKVPADAQRLLRLTRERWMLLWSVC